MKIYLKFHYITGTQLTIRKQYYILHNSGEELLMLWILFTTLTTATILGISIFQPDGLVQATIKNKLFQVNFKQWGFFKVNPLNIVPLRSK